MQINGLFGISFLDEFRNECRFVDQLALMYGVISTLTSPLLPNACTPVPFVHVHGTVAGLYHDLHVLQNGCPFNTLVMYMYTSWVSVRCKIELSL